MFSESSTGSWAELQLPCCPSKQGELPENMLQNLFLNLPPQTVRTVKSMDCSGYTRTDLYELKLTKASYLDRPQSRCSQDKPLLPFRECVWKYIEEEIGCHLPWNSRFNFTTSKRNCETRKQARFQISVRILIENTHRPYLPDFGSVRPVLKDSRSRGKCVKCNIRLPFALHSKRVRVHDHLEAKL